MNHPKVSAQPPWGLRGLVALPIAAEIDARLVRHRQPGDAFHLLAIGDAAAAHVVRLHEAD